jgi:hypothetical protein
LISSGLGIAVAVGTGVCVGVSVGDDVGRGVVVDVGEGVGVIPGLADPVPQADKMNDNRTRNEIPVNILFILGSSGCS